MLSCWATSALYPWPRTCKGRDKKRLHNGIIGILGTALACRQLTIFVRWGKLQRRQDDDEGDAEGGSAIPSTRKFCGGTSWKLPKSLALSRQQILLKHPSLTVAKHHGRGGWDPKAASDTKHNNRIIFIIPHNTTSAFLHFSLSKFARFGYFVVVFKPAVLRRQNELAYAELERVPICWFWKAHDSRNFEKGCLN